MQDLVPKGEWLMAAIMGLSEEQVEEIWEINPAYFAALSEIRVVPTDYDGYEFIPFGRGFQEGFLFCHP